MPTTEVSVVVDYEVVRDEGTHEAEKCSLGGRCDDMVQVCKTGPRTVRRS